MKTSTTTKSTQKKSFVHLHTHTEYSLLDGAARVKDIFAKAHSLNQNAIAITDHGNLFGALEFSKQAVKFTDPQADFYTFMKEKRPFIIKPIIGCEVYCCDNMLNKTYEGGTKPKFDHLVLLAKNEIGYKNLIKIVSFSYTKGFYYKPRVDMALIKKHSKGLICLSGCLGGALAQAVRLGKTKEATEIATEFKTIFKDDYYIEIQDHNLIEQKRIIPVLASIASDLKIKLVATNDLHYVNKEDWAMQKVLQCISFRKQISPDELDEDAPAAISSIGNDATNTENPGTDDSGYFATREYYLKSYDEMLELFPNLEESLTNTQEVADKCECHFFTKQQLFPSFETKCETPTQMLRRLTFEGIARKYKKLTEEVKTRAEYELGLIERLGFVDYFLIVWDFIHYAEKNGIPVGPGRGSGVGSIVAYALNITRPDPLKYGLIFERFLNPDRISNPDFDIDFCVDRREEVIDYVVNKYGAESVSQIITFGSLKSKAALKDVGRVFGYPYSEMDKAAKLFPPLTPLKLADLVGLTEKPFVQDLKNLYDTNREMKRIIDMSIKVEGFPRQTGIHAAGVIICKDPTYNHIPMAIAKKEKASTSHKVRVADDFATTTQFDMGECEELGLLKMDFLGLRTLTDIQNAIDIIKEIHNKEIDFYSFEYDSKKVFDLIGEGDTHAVFQLESEGMKRFMKDLKPTCLEDIIAGVALYRPGPMDNIKQYIKGKHNPKTIKYDTPMLSSILDVTYGIMVYQEQVIQVAQKLAGYAVSHGDELRAMIGKKKTYLFPKERQTFVHGNEKRKINGCVKNGVPEAVANKIWDDIVKFGDYAFNKSHATAYAYLAYQTAYLKTFYLVEYIAAVLNNRIGKIEDIANYLHYLKTKNIKILPPCINKSMGKFSVENGAIRIGLMALKNVGSVIIDQIIAERKKGGLFTDFEDFIVRMSFVTINKRILEGLILTGAFDCFKKHRSQLMQVYAMVVDKTAKDRDARNSGQISLFETFADPAIKVAYPNIKEYPLRDKLEYEKECAGVYISGHPLEEFEEFLNGFEYNSTHLNFEVDDENEGDDSRIKDGEKIALGGMLVDAQKRFSKAGNEFGIAKLEDMFGSSEILLSGRILNQYRKVFESGNAVRVYGSVNYRDDKPTFWVDSIEFAKRDNIIPKQKICFYFDITIKAVYNELLDILTAYPGIDETYVKSTHDNKLYKLEQTITISQTLLLEIAGLIGKDSYRIRK